MWSESPSLFHSLMNKWIRGSDDDPGAQTGLGDTSAVITNVSRSVWRNCSPTGSTLPKYCVWWRSNTFARPCTWCTGPWRKNPSLDCCPPCWCLLQRGRRVLDQCPPCPPAPRPPKTRCAPRRHTAAWTHSTAPGACRPNTRWSLDRWGVHSQGLTVFSF